MKITVTQNAKAFPRNFKGQRINKFRTLLPFEIFERKFKKFTENFRISIFRKTAFELLDTLGRETVVAITRPLMP